MRSQQPVLQALLLADHVYRDAESGKHIIAGTFSQLRGREFPCRFTTPVQVFCVLTQVAGSLAIAMRFLSADDQLIMSSSAVTVTCPDPRLAIELVLPVPSLALPAPGWYRLELLADEQPLGFLWLEALELGLGL